MKRYGIILAAMLTAVCLFTGCHHAGSSSKPVDSSSIPSASSAQPTSTPAPTPASQSQSQSQPQSQSESGSSSASSSQEAQLEWAGTYAREPGSAAQVMLYITQENDEEFHFKFDAKGLVFEGDAVISGDTATYDNHKDYTLVFHLGRMIQIEQIGTFEGGNVSFDGEFESAGR